MKLIIFLLGLVFGHYSIVSFGQRNNVKACVPCEQLIKLQLPDVTILKSKSLTRDSIGRPFSSTEGPFVVSVPFCKVAGVISKEIDFELLLPQNWNGRLLMSGGGGFVGYIQNDLVEYVNRGYAVVGTNAGHRGNAFDASWALNNMERQINFGRLAVHRTAVVSKSIIRSFYCAEPSYSYFLGCSRGGGQGMIEAQYYPEDFDGIVSGAPAITWPSVGAKMIQECQVNYPDSTYLKTPIITEDNLKLLQQYVLQQCDKLDKLDDKIINDPRDCKFDFSQLPLCPGDKEGPGCFTKQQLSAIKTIYTPLLVGNDTVYQEFPYGSEAAWNPWVSGNKESPSFHYLFGTSIFKYLVYNNPSWDYSHYDFKNFFAETRYAASYLDATQTDYSGFKKHNGKMIFYHGWNDPALSAYATIHHFDEAMKKDKDLQSYMRLFLLPGVFHCGGGTGPDRIDWVDQIRDWVEKGKAPEKIVVSKIENGKTIMTRPVYPYPRVTIYNGKGDPNDEKSFTSKD